MLLRRGFQIRMSPKGTLPFDTEATLSGVGDLVAALRRDPAIAEAAPVAATSVSARVGGRRVSFVAYGIDPAEQGIYELIEGSDLSRGDARGLLVDANTVLGSGWTIGDTVRLEGSMDPQTAEPLARRELVVRGIVRWLYDARNQRSVGAVLPVVQQLGGLTEADAASAVMVKVRDGHDVEQVASRLADRYPAVEVNSVDAVVRRVRARLVYFQQLSLILATISLVVAVLLVGTILTIAIGERLGEIAVLRAIGVTRARIVGAVMLEGAILTCAGAAGGTLLGLVTARQLDRILSSFPGLPAAISFFVADGGALVRSASIVIVAGVLAGGYPAWLAARTPVAQTLRGEAE
jgi:putative ABC transport system permease protein